MFFRRSYIFALNYCKIKSLLFRDAQMYLTRINAFNKQQIISRSFIPNLTATLGYQLTVKQPGSRQYINTKRRSAKALCRSQGAFTFFITLTANSSGWEDLDNYLQHIWKLRDAEIPRQSSLAHEDISTSAQFVVQKFRSIRNVLTCKNPNLWSPGKLKATKDITQAYIYYKFIRKI